MASVTATTCVVPLPRPVVMGEIRFDARTETLCQLFQEWVKVENGDMLAPETPGLGVVLDRDAVERFAIRTGGGQ